MTREGSEGRRVTLAVEDREFAVAAALPTGTLWAVGRSDNADLIVNTRRNIRYAGNPPGDVDEKPAWRQAARPVVVGVVLGWWHGRHAGWPLPTGQGYS